MTLDESSPARPLVYAHRGASAVFAEHTRAAFMQALADGADGVECDVHLTRDGRVVLIHDSTLDRTSDGTGPVAEKTLQELRQLDFSSWKGVRLPEAYGARSEQFLTLEDLLGILQAAGRPVGLAIELKHPSPYQLKLEDRVMKTLTDHGWVAESSVVDNISVSFMSFSSDSISHLLRSVPGDFICQLVHQVDLQVLREDQGLGLITRGAVANVLRAAQAEAERTLNHGAVLMAGPGIDYVRRHAPAVQRWMESGRRFRVWTVDSDEDVALCQGLGIHEITTNKPARVLAQIGSQAALVACD